MDRKCLATNRWPTDLYSTKNGWMPRVRASLLEIACTVVDLSTDGSTVGSDTDRSRPPNGNVGGTCSLMRGQPISHIFDNSWVELLCCQRIAQHTDGAANSCKEYACDSDVGPCQQERTCTSPPDTAVGIDDQFSNPQCKVVGEPPTSRQELAQIRLQMRGDLVKECTL